jgi:hypothetical protein
LSGALGVAARRERLAGELEPAGPVVDGKLSVGAERLHGERERRCDNVRDEEVAVVERGRHANQLDGADHPAADPGGRDVRSGGADALRGPSRGLRESPLLDLGRRRVASRNLAAER